MQEWMSPRYADYPRSDTEFKAQRSEEVGDKGRELRSFLNYVIYPCSSSYKQQP